MQYYFGVKELFNYKFSRSQLRRFSYFLDNTELYFKCFLNLLNFQGD